MGARGLLVPTETLIHDCKVPLRLLGGGHAIEGQGNWKAQYIWLQQYKEFVK